MSEYQSNNYRLGVWGILAGLLALAMVCWTGLGGCRVVYVEGPQAGYKSDMQKHAEFHDVCPICGGTRERKP